MTKTELWHPPLAKKKELCAELKYGEDVFEIPYSLINYMTGWLSVGMHDSHAPVKACKDILNTFRYLDSAMGYDSNPPTDDEKKFYKDHSIPCARPKLNIST